MVSKQESPVKSHKLVATPQKRLRKMRPSIWTRRAALPVTPTSSSAERSHAMVSDAVRHAMVTRVAKQGVRDDKGIGCHASRAAPYVS